MARWRLESRERCWGQGEAALVEEAKTASLLWWRRLVQGEAVDGEVKMAKWR